MVGVDKFCCGCDLKTGALIIGVVHLLMGLIIGVVHLLMGLLSTAVGLAELSGNTGHVKIIHAHGNTVFGSLDTPDAFAIYAVLIGPLEILVASILMYGAMRRNSNALVPYLVFIPLDVIIDWIILGLQLYPADLLYTVLYMILLTIIYLYFWICIFSFWNVLKKAFVHVEIHVAP